ncbi:MAG TPA: hypothetical protein VMS08_02705 [Candidatus Saccharimonadia bacterium]|nr:hypothetical protein [Candidatus Saccharimonadia bacterium]
MAITSDKSIAHLERTAKQIAVRQHGDLVDLRRETKHTRRTIETKGDEVVYSLDAATQQGKKFNQGLETVSGQMDALLNLTKIGILANAAYQRQIAESLRDMVHMARYPKRTLGGEQRENGIYALGQGLLSDAIEDLNLAVHYFRYDYVSLYGLGYAYARSKRYDEAAPVLARAFLFSDGAHELEGNAAMGAQAAMLSAKCYDKLGQAGKATQVLWDAMRIGCPDVTVMLAARELDVKKGKIVAMRLAKAFEYDVKLIATAEELGVPGIDVAASEALRNIETCNSALASAHKQLIAFANQVGIVLIDKQPRRSQRTVSVRLQLLNAASYRGQLQTGLAALQQELRVKSRETENPPRPSNWTPNETESPAYSITRLILAIIMGLLAAQCSLYTILTALDTLMKMPGYRYADALVALPQAIILWLIVIALRLPELRQKRRNKRNTENYWEMVHNVERRQADVARRNEERQAQWYDVDAAIAAARTVIESTLPPSVPRAFMNNNTVGFIAR